MMKNTTKALQHERDYEIVIKCDVVSYSGDKRSLWKTRGMNQMSQIVK